MPQEQEPPTIEVYKAGPQGESRSIVLSNTPEVLAAAKAKGWAPRTVGAMPSPLSVSGVKSRLYSAAPKALATLPMVGGTLGGVAGGAAGTPFDLLTGPTGTAGGAVLGATLGGAAGKGLENRLRAALGYDAPTTVGGEASSMLSEAGIQGLAQVMGEGGSQWLVSATKNPKVAEVVRKYWQSRGIRLTAGERAPTSWAGAVESKAAQTAVAKEPVSRMLGERQEVLQRLSGGMAQRLGTAEPALPQHINNVIEGSIDRMERTITEAVSRTGSEAAGGVRAAIPPDVFADAVVGAIRGTHEATDLVERELYGQARQLVAMQDIMVKQPFTSQSADFARTELKRAMEAGGVGAAHIDPSVQAFLGRAGRGRTLDAAAKKMFDSTFESLQEAEKTALMQMLDATAPVRLTTLMDAYSGATRIQKALEAKGLYDDASLGALKKWRMLARQQIMDSAPTPVRDMLNQAYAVTRTQKEIFNSAFLRSVMRKKNPITSAAIVQNMLRRNDSAAAEDLLKAVGPNHDAWPIIRKGATDWVETTAGGDPEKMVKLADTVPGLQYILGPEFPAYRARLQTIFERTGQPERVQYIKWLVAGRATRSPEKLIDNAISSTVERQYLDAAIYQGGSADAAEAARRGIPTREQLRSNVARDILNRALDKATTMVGAAGDVHFGDPGSYFDPVKFYASFQSIRPALEHFGDPQAVKDLAEFANAGRALQLSHTSAPGATGSMAASWYTL